MQNPLFGIILSGPAMLACWHLPCLSSRQLGLLPVPPQLGPIRVEIRGFSLIPVPPIPSPIPPLRRIPKSHSRLFPIPHYSQPCPAACVAFRGAHHFGLNSDGEATEIICALFPGPALHFLCLLGTLFPAARPTPAAAAAHPDSLLAFADRETESIRPGPITALSLLI